MPFKISEVVEVDVDSSVSSFDPNETTIEETSMILLAPPARKDTTNGSPLAQQQHESSMREDSAHSNHDDGSFVDPDETMMTLSPPTNNTILMPTKDGAHTGPCANQSNQHLGNASIPHDSNDKENIFSPLTNFNDGSRLSASPLQTQAKVDTRINRDPSQSQQSTSSETRKDDNVDTEMGGISHERSPPEQIYQESYKSVVTSIIAKNKNLVRLPRSHDQNVSIDDRISNLYRFMESSGVYSIMGKLGVGRRHTKGGLMNFEDKSNRLTRLDGNDVDSRAATQNERFYMDQQRKHMEGLGDAHTGQLEEDDCNAPMPGSESTLGTSNLSKDHSFNLSNIDVEKLKNRQQQQQHETQFDKTQLIMSDMIQMDKSKTTNRADSLSPIELPRHCARNDTTESIRMSTSFQSPPTERSIRSTLMSKKRVASTSGKKGIDIHRIRLEDESSFHPIYEDFSQQVNNIMESPTVTVQNRKVQDMILEHSSNVDLDDDGENQQDSSFLDSALFSQSPIPHRNSILTPQDQSTELIDEAKDSSPHFDPRNKNNCRLSSTSSRVENQINHAEIDRDKIQRRSAKDEETLSQYSLSPIQSRVDTGGRSEHLLSDDLLSENRYGGLLSKDNCNMEMKKGERSFSPDHTHTSEHSYDDQLHDECHDECESFQSGSDSIESVDSDILREQHRKQKMNDESIIDDEEGNERNISLKDTSRLHYDPLQVYRPPRWAKIYHQKKQLSKRSKGSKRNKSKSIQIRKPDDAIEKPKPLPTMTYVEEPFKEFGSRDSERLEVVSDWLNEQDLIEECLEETSTSKPAGKAVVITVTIKQILSLSLHLLLKNGVHKISRHDRFESNSRSNLSSGDNSSVTTYGGTLVVARSKQELLEWECGFREKTGFTVLNHAELTSKERRRVTIPTKASGYDVVLTTYDALKTKEMSTLVDDLGRVIDQTNSEGGWFTSRMSSSEEPQHQSGTLSQLHILNWTRLILVDSIGRQSFLTKPATARLQAIAKLKAGSR